jgi:hypothetical protein
MQLPLPPVPHHPAALQGHFVVLVNQPGLSGYADVQSQHLLVLLVLLVLMLRARQAYASDERHEPLQALTGLELHSHGMKQAMA